jgi:hypothetical protein
MARVDFKANARGTGGIVTALSLLLVRRGRRCAAPRSSRPPAHAPPPARAPAHAPARAPVQIGVALAVVIIIDQQLWEYVGGYVGK